MKNDMKPNTKGIKLCERCRLNAEVPGLKKCKACIKEIFKERQELTKPK